MFTRKRIITTLTISLALCLFMFTAWLHMRGAEDSEPVAVVNGEPITRKVFERELRKTSDQYALQGILPGDERLKGLKQEVLERLIETELLWQQCISQGIAITDEVVAEQLEAIKRQYLNETILNTIMENAKMTKSEMVSLIRKDLAIRALVEKEISGGISISDTACETYYRNHIHTFETPEKVKASHVRIFIDKGAPDAEWQKAETAMQSIARRLIRGETFEALASETFDDMAGIDVRVEDLGFIPKGAMEPAIDDALFSLMTHEVSPIIRSSMGYHIIQVSDRQPARALPFDDVKADIRQQLMGEEIYNAVKRYLAGLRRTADIRQMI